MPVLEFYRATLPLGAIDNFGYWLQDYVHSSIAYVSGAPSLIVFISTPQGSHGDMAIASTMPINLVYHLFTQYGRYIYAVTPAGSDITIVDIWDSYNSSVVGSFPTVDVEYVISMCVYNDILILYQDSGVLSFYDLSTPLVPIYLGTYTDSVGEALTSASRCYTKGNFLYICGQLINNRAAFLCYDLSTLPTVSRVYTHIWNNTLSRQLALHNNVAYVLLNSPVNDLTRIGIFDISSGVPVWQTDFGLDAQMYKAMGMTTYDTLLYIVDSASMPNGNLKVYNITNPFTPVLATELLSVQPMLDRACGLIFDPNMLYILQAGANDRAIINMYAEVDIVPFISAGAAGTILISSQYFKDVVIG